MLGAALALSGLCPSPSVASEATATGKMSTRWQRESIVLHVDDSIDWIGPGAFDAVLDAVSTWQLADPELPTIVVERSYHAKVGYNGETEPHNVLRFEPLGTPLARGALAITITAADGATGALLDADIVINGRYAFGVLDPSGPNPRAYDFQNVLTHELGHFLGISEEDTEHHDATMFESSGRGEVHKRDLTNSDLNSIDVLYEQPPAQNTPTGCGGASLTQQSGAAGNPTLLAATLLALGVLWRRRQRSPS